MTNFVFSKRSLNNLQDVHPYLIAVVVMALKVYAQIDFSVIEGVRGLSRQKELFEQKKSQTLNSKHLIQDTQFGHAVDIAPFVDGKIQWDSKELFKTLSLAMFRAAADINVRIRWGGDWNQNDEYLDESFFDGAHFELL